MGKRYQWFRLGGLGAGLASAWLSFAWVLAWLGKIEPRVIDCI